jgi:hypothetical protein
MASSISAATNWLMIQTVSMGCYAADMLWEHFIDRAELLLRGYKGKLRFS